MCSPGDLHPSKALGECQCRLHAGSAAHTKYREKRHLCRRAYLATVLLASPPAVRACRSTRLTSFLCCLLNRAVLQVGRVLAWQIPPRRFFTWWCGGMSVADSLVVAWLLAYNIWYFVYYIRCVVAPKPVIRRWLGCRCKRQYVGKCALPRAGSELCLHRPARAVRPTGAHGRKFVLRRTLKPSQQ